MVDNKHDIESFKCPECGSENHYIYDCDEKDFNSDGTGYINYDHHCKDCDKYFRSYTKFKYEITEQTTSK